MRLNRRDRDGQRRAGRRSLATRYGARVKKRLKNCRRPRSHRRAAARSQRGRRRRQRVGRPAGPRRSRRSRPRPSAPTRCGRARSQGCAASPAAASAWRSSTPGLTRGIRTLRGSRGAEPRLHRRGGSARPRRERPRHAHRRHHPRHRAGRAHRQPQGHGRGRLGAARATSSRRLTGPSTTAARGTSGSSMSRSGIR